MTATSYTSQFDVYQITLIWHLYDLNFSLKETKLIFCQMLEFIRAF